MRGRTSNLRTWLALGGFAFWALSDSERGVAADAKGSAVTVSFALVELYTSEGCSSCPPADRLLAELVAEARRDGKPIYPLAFHVDYWNGLGWTDPWSDAAYSERQAMYADAFDSRYTPQMIVNGTESFVGSDRGRARRAIDAALGHPAGCNVLAEVNPIPEARGHWRVGWTVSPAPEYAVVHVALAERGLTSRVARGENKGRTLVHDNVVRTFESADLKSDGRGETTLAGPSDVKIEHASVVVYVQDAKTHRILGAMVRDLPTAGLPNGESGRGVSTTKR